jgi:hypothetical protein
LKGIEKAKSISDAEQSARSKWSIQLNKARTVEAVCMVAGMNLGIGMGKIDKGMYIQDNMRTAGVAEGIYA